MNLPKINSLLENAHSWESYLETASQLNEKEKGDLFERLTQIYLTQDAAYKMILEEVWLYQEIDEKLRNELSLPDEEWGIDLLTKTKDGKYWAVQCKYRQDTKGSLTKRDLSTFGTLTVAIAQGMTRGIICTTKEEKTSGFAEAKGFDFHHELLDTWETLPSEFWTQVRAIASGQRVIPAKPNEPRDYQRTAIESARKYYIEEGNDRGKLIMACGTGKTLTSFWTARELEASSILVVVPSLDLIRQTLTDWCREADAREEELEVMVVCSDESTVEGDIQKDELPIPVTTQPEAITEWIGQKKKVGATTVVFVTYQSGKVFADNVAGFEFDLAVFDEAHKTAGPLGKANQYLTHEDNILIKWKIFMTATERYYEGRVDDIVGMNNEEVYGTTYHLLDFKEAITRKILAEYKVLLLQITEAEAYDFERQIKEGYYVKPVEQEFDEKILNAEEVASAIALRSSMEENKLGHAISFHSTIKSSEDFISLQERFNELHPSRQIETFQVSSRLTAKRRRDRLEAFGKSEYALISNARCLTEGVDVPAIDLVLFAQPRRSTIDIVQAVGRALRKPNREVDKTAFILVPLIVDEESDDLEEIVKGTGFNNLVSIISAMGQVDGSIKDRIEIKLNKPPKKSIGNTPKDSEHEIKPQDIVIKECERFLQLRAFDKLDGLIKPRITEEQIIEWIEAYKNDNNGKLPTETLGKIPDSNGETWVAVQQALTKGLRGFPGGSSLHQFLVEHGFKKEKQDLTEAQVIKWIKEFIKANGGKLPTQTSGKIPDSNGGTWSAIDTALTRGIRGFPGGSSLHKFLIEHGFKQDKEDLTEAQILEWIKEFIKANGGKLPTQTSGKIPDSNVETWSAIDTALTRGIRGFPGESSLSQFLIEHGFKNEFKDLTEDQILEWIQAFISDNPGKLPAQSSGKILGQKNENWKRIDGTLRTGDRNLPGGSSLHKFLVEHGFKKEKQDLTEAQILDWIKAFISDNPSKLPTQNSGEIPDSDGNKWGNIHATLSQGLRGFPGGSSLHKLLIEHGFKKEKQDLTEDQILQWIRTFSTDNPGKLPTQSSGEIPGSNGETWGGSVHVSLSQGLRGLPGGSSLHQFCIKHGFKKEKEGLTEAQILEWVQAFISDNPGKLPTQSSDEIPGSNGETWSIVNNALHNGDRDLPGGSSLSFFCIKHGFKKDKQGLTEDQILEWIKTFITDNPGRLPTRSSGEIPCSNRETWHAINLALGSGLRGLPAGSSLHKLIKQHGLDEYARKIREANTS